MASGEDKKHIKDLENLVAPATVQREFRGCHIAESAAASTKFETTPVSELIYRLAGTKDKENI